jgi:hypothetical protein
METPSPLDHLDGAIFIALPQESQRDLLEPYTNRKTLEEESNTAQPKTVAFKTIIEH